MNLKTIFFSLLLLFVCSGLQAQHINQLMRKGNKLYKEKKYSEAEIMYLKALEKDSTNRRALYNSANNDYQNKKYEDAIKKYSSLSKENNNDKKQLADNLYNLGNSLLQANALMHINPLYD